MIWQHPKHRGLRYNSLQYSRNHRAETFSHNQSISQLLQNQSLPNRIPRIQSLTSDTSEPTLTEPEPKDAFPTTSAAATVAGVTIVVIAAVLLYSKKRRQ